MKRILCVIGLAMLLLTSCGSDSSTTPNPNTNSDSNLVPEIVHAPNGRTLLCVKYTGRGVWCEDITGKDTSSS